MHVFFNLMRHNELINEYQITVFKRQTSCLTWFLYGLVMTSQLIEQCIMGSSNCDVSTLTMMTNPLNIDFFTAIITTCRVQNISFMIMYRENHL